jgi:hypothetical protein
MPLPHWKPLGKVSPLRLVEARLALHHAVQLVAAVGRGLVPPRPDDGHTSLEWQTGLHGLLGQEVPGMRTWRAALRPRDLTLLLIVDGGIVWPRDLAGRARDEAFAWLEEKALDLGAPHGRLAPHVPYALPEHPVGKGGRFALPGDDSLAEVGRWIADGDALLREVASGWPGSSPVRVWPHHFDVGSVLPLGAGGGEDAASMGAGLSPGDEGIAEPYLYVTPWPPPEAGEALPELPAGGRWHREGWVGAVLTGSEIVAGGAGEAQAARARAFLEGAVSVLRARHEEGRRRRPPAQDGRARQDLQET